MQPRYNYLTWMNSPEIGTLFFEKKKKILKFFKFLAPVKIKQMHMNILLVKGAWITALENEFLFLPTKPGQHKQRVCELPHSTPSSCLIHDLEGQPPARHKGVAQSLYSFNPWPTCQGCWRGCQLWWWFLWCGESSTGNWIKTINSFQIL